MSIRPIGSGVRPACPFRNGRRRASRCTCRCLCPRSRASSGADRNLFAAHESLQIIQLGFTALRDQTPCLGRGVLPWNVGPALNGALRVPQSGGGFSGATAGFATIRLGSCGNLLLYWRPVPSQIRHRPRRRHPPAASPPLCRRSQQRPKAIELPIPEAGVLPSPENLQAAGRPPADKKKAPLPRPDHIVVVILENKHRSSVIGRRQATFGARFGAASLGIS